MSVAWATICYFAAVFGAGLVMGPIRVLVLEPHFGPIGAVAIEAPVLIVAMVLAARWATARAGLEGSASAMIGVGLGALFLQQLAELLVGYWRGIALAEYVAQFETTSGQIYAALLILFAAMPWLMYRFAERSARS